MDQFDELHPALRRYISECPSYVPPHLFVPHFRDHGVDVFRGIRLIREMMFKAVIKQYVERKFTLDEAVWLAERAVPPVDPVAYVESCNV